MTERKDVYFLQSQVGNDTGRVEAEPSVMRVGESSELVITYTAGPAGVRKGGRISIFVPYGWTPPQDNDPSAPGYVSFSSSREGVHCKMRTHSWKPGHFNPEWGSESPRFDNFWVLINGEDLRENDTVTVRWGDRSEGGPGLWPAPVALDMQIPVCVWDGSGPNYFYFLREPIRIKILGGEPEHLEGTLPSIMRPGEKAVMIIRGHDRYDEISGADEFEVEAGPAGTAILPSENNHASSDEVSFSETGIHRITLSGRGIESRSDPVKVSEKGERIYWGDPHVHTALSDGLGKLDEAYEYGRDIMGLDFVSITDHMNAKGDGADRFRQLQEAAMRFNKPGKFVTVPGYEGSRFAGCGGDVNVYFLGDDEPIIWLDEDHQDMSSIISGYDPDTTIFSPHTHIGVNWDIFDSSCFRMFEIYSVWGNSEYFGAPMWNVGSRQKHTTVQAGLALGLRFGIVGGGDDHAGHSGNSHWLRTARTYRNGLTAVLAQTLDRENIFRSMQNRKVYATTGKRIILEFTAGGIGMGSEGVFEKGFSIDCEVHGTAPIRKITLIRNGEDIYSETPGQWDAELSWEEKSSFAEIAIKGEKADKPFVYYYIRVEQNDGHMAWSSPVWFTE